MDKVKIGLLANEDKDSIRHWRISLELNPRVVYDVIDFTSNNWLQECLRVDYDVFIAHPPGMTSQFKQLYDERLMVLSRSLKRQVYPSLDEVLIYENKRYLSFWLKALGISHPSTSIFYYEKEALSFVSNTSWPQVAKINIGAAGSGVVILKTEDAAKSYIKKAFREGVVSKSGPQLAKGSPFEKLMKIVKDPSYLRKRMKQYKSISEDKQKGFIILQEYIAHDYEWRCVRIGDSFFAHKKMVKGEMASGTLSKGYDTPPIQLLDFIKELTDKHQLRTVAVDVFENPKEGYLVNEIQTVFGQSDDYQMKVDGVIGRYIYKDDWVFEEGDFNTNKSYDLRLEDLINCKA